MRHERAVEIGQQAVGLLLARPERLVELVSASGVSPDALPRLVEDPDFLGFALDFVMSSDDGVLAFAGHAGLRPEEPALARATLAGPGLADWP